MPVYNNIYGALKAADASNAVGIIAAAAQAWGWEPAGLARFCRLIGADPKEVDGIVRQARDSKDRDQPWFVTP